MVHVFAGGADSLGAVEFRQRACSFQPAGSCGRPLPGRRAQRRHTDGPAGEQLLFSRTP